MKKAIGNDLASYYAYTQMGALRSFGEMYAGSIELLQKGQNIEHIEETLAALFE